MKHLPIFLALLLIQGCHLELLDPVKNGLLADFTVLNSGPLYAPVDVEFSNLSSEAIEYEWDFGDGSAVSNEFNPSHRYNDPGEYTVTLIVMDDLGQEEFVSRPITVTSATFLVKRNAGDSEVFKTNQVFSLGDSLYALYGSYHIPSGQYVDFAYYNRLGEKVDPPQPYFSFCPSDDYTGLYHSPTWIDDPLFTTCVVGNVEEVIVTTFVLDLPTVQVYDVPRDFNLVASRSGRKILFGDAVNNRLELSSGFEENYSIGEPGQILSIQVSEDDILTVLKKFRTFSVPDSLSLEQYDLGGLLYKTTISHLGSDENFFKWSFKQLPQDKYLVVGQGTDPNSTLWIRGSNQGAGERSIISLPFYVKDLFCNNENELIITGDEGPNVSIVKANESGQIIWEKTHQIYQSNFSYVETEQIIQTPDGGYLIWGNGGEGFNNESAFLLKVDSEGRL